CTVAQAGAYSTPAYTVTRRSQMSLRVHAPSPIPEETVRVAEVAFPKGNAYMQMRDVLGTVYDDARFAPLLARRGRHAAPARPRPAPRLRRPRRHSRRASAHGDAAARLPQHAHDRALF